MQVPCAGPCPRDVLQRDRGGGHSRQHAASGALLCSECCCGWEELGAPITGTSCADARGVQELPAVAVSQLKHSTKFTACCNITRL